MEENEKDRNCRNCPVVTILKKGNKKLRDDNERLLREQDFMFLALDLFLEAVKLWGQQNGLLKVDGDLNNGITGKLDVMFNKFGKEDITKDKVMALLNILGNTPV